MDLLGKTSMGCAARRQEGPCREQAANMCKALQDLAWLIGAGTGGNLQCPFCSLKQWQNLLQCLNPHLPCKIHLAIIKHFLGLCASDAESCFGGDKERRQILTAHPWNTALMRSAAFIQRPHGNKRHRALLTSASWARNWRICMPSYKGHIKVEMAFDSKWSIPVFIWTLPSQFRSVTPDHA